MAGLAAANLAIGSAMLPAQLRMRRAAGRGIIALELAGSERSARALMRAWGRDGCRSARRLQWLDFAYLATYAPFFRLATLAAGERLRHRGHGSFATLAPPLAQAQLAAGALDAVEQAALLGVLNDARGDGLLRLAFGSAAGKFVLLGAGWLYILVAVGMPARAQRELETATVPNHASPG